MSWRFAALALLLAPPACKQHSSGPPPLPSASSAPAESTIARAQDAQDAQVQDADPEGLPLDSGPSAAGVALPEREQHVRELISGQASAERLPLVVTESNLSYDPGLFRRLTTELDTAGLTSLRGLASVSGPGEPLGPRVSATIGELELLSGALDEPQALHVTMSMRAGFRVCYQRAIVAQGEPKSARIGFEVSVAETGVVAAATPLGSQPPSLVPFLNCAKARIQASEYPPPGKPSRLSFTVELRATSSD